jgi:exonuclease SbcC
MLLVAWAASRGPAERRRAEAARAQAGAAARQVAVIVGSLRAELSAAGVATPGAEDGDGHDSSTSSIVTGWSAGEAVAAARATALSEAARLAAAVQQADGLRAELAIVEEVAVVARTLALHLKADRFEKWLLDEALQELVDGATGTLYGLSGGAYSLCLDDRREFAVVDHRNADERRPVRTLSGGETFLASLALALALADRVAALATGGGARLESLFLDEGFGTLDPETLDTVAAAIEQLQAGGRMVGIITHVRDLAERVPVRFEVSRGPGGSTVERVLA